MSRKAPVDRIVSQVTPNAASTTWTAAAHRMFQVVGEVLVKACFGVVNVAVTGTSTAEVGVAGDTACLIAQCSDATTYLDAVNDVWVGRGTCTYGRYSGAIDGGGVVLSGIGSAGSIDIDLKVSAECTTGQITIYIVYVPISGDGCIHAVTWD